MGYRRRDCKHPPVGQLRQRRGRVTLVRDWRAAAVVINGLSYFFLVRSDDAFCLHCCKVTLFNNIYSLGNCD